MCRCLGKQGAMHDLPPAPRRDKPGKGSLQSETVLLTCPASPRRKLSNLVPSVLLKVIAFHTADGLGRLATNHDHHLQKDKRTLAGSLQHLVTNPRYFHMLPAQGLGMTRDARSQSYVREDAAPDHQQTRIFEKRLMNVFPQKHNHKAYASQTPLPRAMLRESSAISMPSKIWGRGSKFHIKTKHSQISIKI